MKTTVIPFLFFSEGGASSSSVATEKKKEGRKEISLESQ
jgi:hypothetical protein